MNKDDNKISPDLEKALRKYDPRGGMNVPDGYFESFADELMIKIKKGEDEESKKIKRLFSKQAIFGIAASIAILVASVLLFPKDFNSAKNLFVNLEEDQTWDYVLENPSNFSIEDFASFDEIEETLNDLEAEFYGDNISEQFIDEIDSDIIEDLYRIK